MPIYHAVYDLLKVLLPYGRRAVYVLGALHCKVSLISLFFTNKNYKIREMKMRYIDFFEKSKIIFSYITVSDILLCYNTLNKSGGNEYDCK